MNNPNETILLTEDGHPIGDIVIADNSSVPAPADKSVETSRDEQMRAVAAEVSGDPDADGAIAEWFPGYSDGEKRKMAMTMFIAEGRTLEDISRAVGVPCRTVSQWMYVGQWERVVKQELAARQAASSIELARIRAERRASVAREQLKAAATVRKATLEKLDGDEVSVKSAAEALKSAADVEARILGVAESGALDDAVQGQDKKSAEGKTPLVMVFQGGLPPIRKATSI